MPEHNRPADGREDVRARVDADSGIPRHAIAALAEILNRIYGGPKTGHTP